MYSSKTLTHTSYYHQHKWDNHRLIKVDSVNFKNSTSLKNSMTISIDKLHHYTEYLFVISACHAPHDAYGVPLQKTVSINHLPVNGVPTKYIARSKAFYSNLPNPVRDYAELSSETTTTGDNHYGCLITQFSPNCIVDLLIE
ncbi:unnamed protein product [Trichobilharzia regenti]|nr:unnamed protein product [Trichobilharzia regenti]